MQEVEPLSWLDAGYVQKILRKSEKDESIRVSGINVKPATAKGDNYTSNMYRIAVVYSRICEGHETTQTRSIIVKVAPTNDAREEMVSSGGYFEVEMSVGFEILPQMKDILDNVIATTFAARFLYVQYEKPIHLIVEDLVPKGFKMANRQAGLDLEHCLLAMRNIAAFHASSIALGEKNPEALEALKKYERGMFHKDRREGLASFYGAAVGSMGEEVAKWPELSPRISEKISKLSKVAYDKGCEAAILREDDFKVLTHGDCWVNNMLFRYNDQGTPIDHAFVDFQVSSYNHPAMDILYFLAMSPDEEVRADHREVILREYHSYLVAFMAKMKCATEPLSFTELQASMKSRGLCEVIVSFAILPVAIADQSYAKTYNETISTDGKYHNPVYGGKKFRRIMGKVLPLYDAMGLLDSP